VARYGRKFTEKIGWVKYKNAIVQSGAEFTENDPLKLGIQALAGINIDSG
jgi:hypothetical protein